jgi:hypothetical protein
MTFNQILFVISILYLPLSITSSAIIFKHLAKEEEKKTFYRFIIIQAISYLIISAWAILGIIDKR